MKLTLIALIAALSALAAETPKESKPSTAPVIEPAKKAELFKAFAHLNKAVAEKNKAALDSLKADRAFAAAKADEDKYKADVDALTDKLCPAGFVAVPGENDDPKCAEEPKPAEKPAVTK